jgi:chorismate synthase
MNSSGRVFRVSLFGESHGPALGALVDGCPPGLPLDEAAFAADLGRRKAGAPGTTARVEEDRIEILSGLYDGHTTGTPILLLFRNTDTRSSDYAAFAAIPRPGHADLTGRIRYRGFADPRGSGHFSGRITLGLVAAGVIAKRLLPGVAFTTTLLEAGGRRDVEAACAEAQAAGDSIGGLLELEARGLPAGLGEPFFDAVESVVSHDLFAVPGVRGVEFGDGFRAASMRGSGHNDPIISVDGRTSRNGAGGVNGGITNGNSLVVRVAVKPASSIALPQRSLDFGTGREGLLEAKGRHDACIALRAAVALEAAMAIALADLTLISHGYDHATGDRHDA